MLSSKLAQDVAKDLSNYSEEYLGLIHKLTGDVAVMKKWLDAERRLRAIREVHEALEGISWEDKANEIYELCSEAEDSVNAEIEAVNECRRKLDIAIEAEE